MTDWVVRRWARYGHERLYAETPGGTPLGYLDVKTGLYHADELTDLPLLRRAIEEHLAVPQHAATPAAPWPAEAANAYAVRSPAPARQAVGPVVAEREWRDLAATGPGAAARRRALAEREAQGTVRHVFARLVGAKTDERAWRIGADGEEAVAEQLAMLGPAWRVLHAVEVGGRGSDIDHVVIGPGGVFTVNTKNHPRASVWVAGDTFLINGRRAPYIRNSRYEARRAARLLTARAGFPVTVSGVVAVLGAHRGVTVREQPDDGSVVVVTRRQIRRYLLTRRPDLSAAEVAAVYDVARRSTTWL